jgi:hypothetical protein
VGVCTIWVTAIWIFFYGDRLVWQSVETVYVIFRRQIICNSGVSNVCSVGSLDTCKIVIVLAGSLGPKCWMTATTRILLAPCFRVPSSPSFPLFLLSRIMLHEYCFILVKTRTIQSLLCWSLGTKSLFWSTVALALLSQSSRTHRKWTLVSTLPFTLSLIWLFVWIYIYIYQLSWPRHEFDARFVTSRKF